MLSQNGLHWRDMWSHDTDAGMNYQFMNMIAQKGSYTLTAEANKNDTTTIARKHRLAVDTLRQSSQQWKGGDSCVLRDE